MAAIASSFEVTPFSSNTGAPENTELNFSGLYLHHIYSGPKPYQSTIIPKDATTGLGSTAVNNWPIYDGVGPDAKLVARAQGLHIFAGNWHTSFTIVFEVERFKGCTLEVMGVNVNEDGQWAIVGGTGEFTMACGVINRKVHQRRINGKQGNIIGLTIHGFCRNPLGITEQSPPTAPEHGRVPPTEQSPPPPKEKSPPSDVEHSPPIPTEESVPTPTAEQNPTEQSPLSATEQSPLNPTEQSPPSASEKSPPTITKIGPWGGIFGPVRDITEKPQRLESITVGVSGILRSFGFTYVDQAGQSHTEGPWGLETVLEPDTILLGPSEFVKEVSGTFGEGPPGTVMFSIKFVTNVKSYGPFGSDVGAPFTTTIPENDIIVGFHGRSEMYLEALGVYTRSEVL